MARTHHLSTTGALIVCLVGTQLSGTLLASETEPSSASSEVAPAALSWGKYPARAVDVSSISPWTPEVPLFTLAFEHENLTADVRARPAIFASTAPIAVDESSSFAQRGRYRGGRGRGGRNAGPAAAIVLGAVASVAGAAVLVYANRPDCRANPRGDACGYGTKVVGGAVLAGGLVGLIAGALTWR